MIQLYTWFCFIIDFYVMFHSWMKYFCSWTLSSFFSNFRHICFKTILSCFMNLRVLLLICSSCYPVDFRKLLLIRMVLFCESQDVAASTLWTSGCCSDLQLMLPCESQDFAVTLWISRFCCWYAAAALLWASGWFCWCFVLTLWHARGWLFSKNIFITNFICCLRVVLLYLVHGF